MPQPRAHSALLLRVVAIASLHVAANVADPMGASATASNRGSYAAGTMQPREFDDPGEAANGPEVVPTPKASLTPHLLPTKTSLEADKAAKQLLHQHVVPTKSETAVTEAEAVDRGFAKLSRRRQLLARLQTAVNQIIDTTAAASGSEVSLAAAQTADATADAEPNRNTHAAADTNTTTFVNTTAEAGVAASQISNTGHQKVDSNFLLNLTERLVATNQPNATLTTSTNSTWASSGDLLYDLTLDSSDVGTFRSDPETLETANLDSLGSNPGTLDVTDSVQGYSDQTGLLQDQMSLLPTEATSAAALEHLIDAVAAMAGKPSRPRGPVTDWPAVPPGLVNPRPPCLNKMVQQDDRCVCPPGFGINDAFNGCVRCPHGWVSNGGPLVEARCAPCPELTKSNTANTACVISVGQPDVNQALCKTCFDPAQPFAPPACCPKGQVCCGTFGCCSINNCINNATTNNQPFCCEAASPPCPNLLGRPFGMNCCQKGTTCLNTTTPTCCPLGGVCLGSTPANTKCCNPPQASTCAVDRTGLALCCAGPFCLNAGIGGNGACCNAGESCIEQRKCCAGVNAQVCRNPAATDPSLAEICCAEDSTTACISSPVNPGLRLCCPTATSSFVCGNDCCDRSTQQCVNQAECCDNENVCPSPLNPNVEICCATGSCDPVTKTCI